MQPSIESIKEKILIGKRTKMSYSQNKTFELWRSFLPKRKEIKNHIGADLYSVEVYPPSFFDQFNPGAEFEKWAAVAVTDFNTIPEDLEPLTVPGGLYAVFLYKGPASGAAKIYQYILGTWLPDSEFILDNRPHMAVMGEKYKNEDPSSEEELWIPVKRKKNS